MAENHEAHLDCAWTDNILNLKIDYLDSSVVALHKNDKNPIVELSNILLVDTNYTDLHKQSKNQAFQPSLAWH